MNAQQEGVLTHARNHSTPEFVSYLTEYFRGVTRRDPRRPLTEIEHGASLLEQGLLVQVSDGLVVVDVLADGADDLAVARRRKADAERAKAARDKVRAAAWTLDDTGGTRERVPDLWSWAEGHRAAWAEATTQHDGAVGAITMWFRDHWADGRSDTVASKRKRANHLYAWWCQSSPDRRPLWDKYCRDKRVRERVREDVERWYRHAASWDAAEGEGQRNLAQVHADRVQVIVERMAELGEGELPADLWSQPWPTAEERVAAASLAAEEADAAHDAVESAAREYAWRYRPAHESDFTSPPPPISDNYAITLAYSVFWHLRVKAELDLEAAKAVIAPWREVVQSSGQELDDQIKTWFTTDADRTAFIVWAARRAAKKFDEDGRLDHLAKYVLTPSAVQSYHRQIHLDRKRRR